MSRECDAHQLGEDGVIAAGAREFAARGVLGRRKLGDVEGKMAQHGKVLWPVVLAVAQPASSQWVRTTALGRSGDKAALKDIVAHLGCGLAGALAPRLGGDHAVLAFGEARRR